MSLTWVQKRRLIQFFEQTRRDHPTWPVVITEGDSWFSFPIHANLVDQLDELAQRRIALLRLERSGHELLSILSGRQKAKIRRYLRRYPVDALLLSGGGNDIAGADLPALLQPIPPGGTWRDAIREDRLDRRLRQLELAYLDLLDIRDDERPSCTVYLHGYDRAVPSGRAVKIFGLRLGPWLQPGLEAHGIVDPDDQRRIVGELIDRFNDVLAGIAAVRPEVEYVDFRGLLGAGDWNDELHPTRDGFGRVARQLASRLAGQFPQTFPP